MNELIHEYRKRRQHQLSVYPSCETRLPNGKVELTAASAPYGEHALSAYRSAKSYIAWVKEVT